jgi:tight adherence protein C
MGNTALFISVLVFTAITTLSCGLYYYVILRNKRAGLVNKIKYATGVLDLDETESGHPDKHDQDSPVKKHISNLLIQLGNFSKPKNEEDISQTRLDLIRAGYRKSSSVVLFYGAKIFIAALLLTVYVFYKVIIMSVIPADIDLQGISRLSVLLYSAIGILVGFNLPNYWLRLKIKERQNKILEGFPDALDLMIVCVEAGMGLDAAINRTAKEMELSNKIISDEFKMVSLELRAGKLRRDALKNLAARIGLEDVNSLISLLIQTDKFGTSVAQALRVHSDSMRVKRFQKAEELAAKLPVKLVFPLIIFIFPSIFVVLLGPAIIRISTTIFPALAK